MPQQTTIKWSTPGKKLNLDANGKLPDEKEPVKEGTVDITETGNSFYLPDMEQPAIAGIPIDANLAVYLVKCLFDKLASMPGKPENVIENEKWLINLLLQSRAITVDKNVLLKTISQPGCEGVRYYLCTKPNEAAAEGEPGEILSFVMVGVDKDGKDLGYTFETDKAANIVDNIFGIETTSLLSEYSFPPPPRTFTKASGMETYILGGYAWPDNF